MHTIKPFLRVAVRIVLEIFHRLLLNLFDTLFGFLNWPSKKLRLKILVLRGENDSVAITPGDLAVALKFASTVFKNRFNIDLLPVKNDASFTDVIESPAPYEVLFTKGGIGALKDEFGIAGNFFATNLKTSFYPVTTFVVIDIINATGCSLGPMTDYITLSRDGAKNESVLAHELAHACGLWHVKDKQNLLWHTNTRGSNIRWWQKNIFRGSRHVTYW